MIPMKLKRIAAITAASVMLTVCFTGCNPSNKNETSVSTIDVLAECTLSEEEMVQAITDYYTMLGTVMSEQNGETSFSVTKSKNEIVITASLPDGNENTLSWSSAKEAYEFLYMKGQLDLEGNILAISDATIQTQPETTSETK